MWFPSLLFLVAFIGVKASIQEDFNGCMAILDPEKIEALEKLAGEEELNGACSILTEFLSCITNVIEDNTGFELAVIEQVMRGTEIGKGFTILLNAINLVDDLCTEGSELREEYLQDAECYSNIDHDLIEKCDEEYSIAYEAHQDFENSIDVEEGEIEVTENEECMRTAYYMGCIAADIHKECGEHAFRTYMKIVKRLNIFRIAICSEEGLETLKTTFVDSLVLETPRKELFRLAFDLKKRRK